MKNKGFTIIELLVVVAIFGFISVLVLHNIRISDARAKAEHAASELESVAIAVQLYLDDHNGEYPPDVDRSIPPGLEEYLAPGNWPDGPWPDSVFDWDYWYDGEIIQITLRMCPLAGACTPPFKNWSRNSSMYYCLKGACVPHQDSPNDPGWCINCPGTKMPELR